MKRIIILLVTVMSISNLFAQHNGNFIEIEQPTWEHIITPSKGPILSTFAEANDRMWIADSGLEYSDDGGQT
jgi:hypothetical protein